MVTETQTIAQALPDGTTWVDRQACEKFDLGHFLKF